MLFPQGGRGGQLMQGGADSHGLFEIPSQPVVGVVRVSAAVLPTHMVGYAGFLPLDSGGTVAKFAPTKPLKLIARCKLTFDERVVVHRTRNSGKTAGSAERRWAFPEARDSGNRGVPVEHILALGCKIREPAAPRPRASDQIDQSQIPDSP